MKTLNKDLLNTGAFLFAAIVLLFMLGQWLMAPNYKLSNEQWHERATSDQHWILPYQLAEMLADNRLENQLLVDLRKTEAFEEGSFPGAINIPFEQLLEPISLKKLKAAESVILFDGQEEKTAAAGLLLQSQGVDGIKLLANDYQYLKANLLDTYKAAAAFNRSEKARFDYGRFFKQAPVSQQESARSIPKITEVEMVSVDGGC